MEKQDSLEINIVDLYYYCKQRIWIPIASCIVCALVSFIVSAMFITPQYTASTRVYILNRANESSVAYSDLQVSNLLSKDYESLVTGRNVTKEVIKELGLNLSDSQLANKISVTSQEDTRILQINVTDPDPEKAAQIANAVRIVASEQIMSIMEIDAVNLVYEAEAPSSPSSPNVSQNVILMAVAGIVVALIALVIAYLIDDSVKTEEDVERYLHLTTLGVIPLSSKLDEGRTNGKGIKTVPKRR